MDIIEIDTKTGNVIERNYTKDEIKEVQQFYEINYEIDYNQKVVELIREKYTIDNELAIIRQRETKQSEFDDYFRYCEECKLKAKNVQL